MKSNKIIVGFVLITLISSCKKSNGDYDASGSFESTEIIISAETSGRILAFLPEEGDQLTANQEVVIIDSTQLFLKKLQLNASMKALESRRPDLQKQIATIEQQIVTAKTERKRVENLVKANAATTKQLDDINAQILVLEKQLTASRSSIETTNQGLSGEAEALRMQVLQIDDQLRKCRVMSPIAGTVLTKYAETGELAVPGKALLKIADTDHMVLRAYITADQLTQIKLGQKVKVLADFGDDDQKEYVGQISWISSKSEFTPKTIQTRDERANLVYAVKIRVKNDGYLKIGMYASVLFK